MKRTIWLTAIFGAIMLIGWLSGPGSANPPATQPYPRPCPNVCVPNVKNFGYYQTHWRKWPGEERPEQINPKRPESEVVPTPPGQEIIPPPRAAVPQPPRPQDGDTFLPEGEITAPSGLLIPENEPSANEDLLHGNGLPELPPLQPESIPNSQPVPQPSTQPESKLPESKAPANTSGRYEPERRNYPPRRDVATSPAMSNERPDRIAPMTGAVEPERTPRFGNSRRHGGLAPYAGAIEPERNAAYNMPSYEPTTHNRDEGVTPVAGDMEPERTDPLHGVHRADSISSSMPERTAREVEPAAYATAESAGMAEAGDQFVVPPVALNGYCPVELAANGRWTPGDLRWTVVHDGLIYRLSGDRQRREFLANPDRYAPVESGKDRVLLVDRGQEVAGNLEFCAIYMGQLYIFSSAESQARFNANPQRYTTGK